MTVPFAPNTESFPKTTEDFLNGSDLNASNYHQVLKNIEGNVDDRENKYPSLEVISGLGNDPTSLLKFITEIIDRLNLSGNIALYGAGSLTEKYIEYLKDCVNINVVAVFDRNANALSDFHDVPLIHPSDHELIDFDYLLILHFHWELDMAKVAISHGVDPKKIITAISDVEIQEGYLKDACLIEIDRLIKRISKKTNLTISTMAPKWSVIDMDDFNKLFEPEHTHHLLYSNPNMHFDAWHQSGISFLTCPRSRPYLRLLLTELNPKNVYIRVSPHTNSEWLSTFVRSVLPDAIIVAEYYDMSVLFSDTFLREKLLYSSSDLDVAKASTYRATNMGIDYLVCKSGGRHWKTIQSTFTTQCGKYFPLLSGNELPESKQVGFSAAKKTKGPVKVIYAGSVPADEITKGLGCFPGANMFRYFYEMTEKSDICVHLFNAGDHDEIGKISEDNNLLRRTFSQGPIRYYPSIPFSELLNKAGEYDYGFTAVHYPGDFTENVTRSGIGNRFMGYLMAGLPVIVDSYFEYQAELILEFNAGIVIQPEDMHLLADIVSNTDTEALREGVIKLREHMIKENTKTYEYLKKLFK